MCDHWSVENQFHVQYLFHTLQEGDEKQFPLLQIDVRELTPHCTHWRSKTTFSSPVELAALGIVFGMTSLIPTQLSDLTHNHQRLAMFIRYKDWLLLPLTRSLTQVKVATHARDYG